MRLEDLDYELPPEAIAQLPLARRDDARLLCLDRESGALNEIRFGDLGKDLDPHDLLVVNDTRVLAAKLRGRKRSGGRCEALLLERAGGGTWRALLRAGGRLRPGLELRFGNVRAEVTSVESDGVSLRFDAPDEVLLEQLGEAPLPPYIRREVPRKQDLEDYQSVFSRVPGAVAAPTASLHFTSELAATLPIATLTLHVGPGTFRPIRSRELDEAAPEAERYTIPEATAAALGRAKERGGRAIAVGTTVARALETTGGAAGSGSTSLFIRPGHRFRAIDSLITNFHLPLSTLLALVMAFAGVEPVRAAYRHALAAGFRFYSYGDAMWIR